MEQRVHKRVQFDHLIAINAPSGGKIVLKAFDYSEAGMGLVGLISRPVPKIGDILSLRFSMSPHGETQKLSIDGEVKYIYLKDFAYTIGVGFSPSEMAK